MHGAAESFAKPACPAKDLRHHRLGIGAENQRVAVASIGAKSRIALPEMAERADDGAFRAIGQVCMAANHARMVREGALHALLESADSQHLGEHPDLAAGVGWLKTHWIRSCEVDGD